MDTSNVTHRAPQVRTSSPPRMAAEKAPAEEAPPQKPGDSFAGKALGVARKGVGAVAATAAGAAGFVTGAVKGSGSEKWNIPADSKTAKFARWLGTAGLTVAAGAVAAVAVSPVGWVAAGAAAAGTAVAAVLPAAAAVGAVEGGIEKTMNAGTEGISTAKSWAGATWSAVAGTGGEAPPPEEGGLSPQGEIADPVAREQA